MKRKQKPPGKEAELAVVRLPGLTIQRQIWKDKPGSEGQKVSNWCVEESDIDSSQLSG